MALADDLISKGVLRTPRIIEAFRKVNRKDFVSEDIKDLAYHDVPLSIGAGQTISQPFTVAFMLELLNPQRGDTILDVGFGSGWQTSLLAEIVGIRGSVIAYERIPELYELGKKNIKKYGYVLKGIVEPRLGDATEKLPGKYTRIIAAAKARQEPPKAWLEALENGGTMVLPIGSSLWVYKKKENGSFEKKEYPGFAFVPLVQNLPEGRRTSINRWVIGGIFGTFLFFMVGLAYVLGLILPPMPEEHETISVRRGMNAYEIATELKKHNVIRSKLLFVWAAYVSGIDDKISTGAYSFSEPITAIQVLKELKRGQKEEVILIPEGATIVKIAEILEAHGMAASHSFITVAQSYPLHEIIESSPMSAGAEGFLFPDTYRLYVGSESEEIIETLVTHFLEKIKPLSREIEDSVFTPFEIVTLASIIEREVWKEEDKKIVSGILQRRLKEEIPLQADATLFYENGRASHELTRGDLAAPTPYNTYSYTGLPPGPIGSPGFDALYAVLYPDESPYLFYLSDIDGNTHYASTLDEHVENKRRYLR